MATQLFQDSHNRKPAPPMPETTIRPDVSVTDVTASLDLEYLQKENDLRKDMKRTVPAGPWYVHAQSYRGCGSKFDIRRKASPLHLAGQPADTDELVLPEGHDKPIKDFVAFCRNDEPEAVIDQLLASIRRLSYYESQRKQMADYINLIERKNHALNAQVESLQADNARIQAEFDQYRHDTEALHANAAILRSALQFYGAERNWEWSLMHNPILRDNGHRARVALSESMSGEETMKKLHKLERLARTVSEMVGQADAGEPYAVQDLHKLAEVYHTLNQGE